MAMNVSSISPILPPQAEPLVSSSQAGGQFREVLSSALDQVELSRNAASQNVQTFLSGGGDDLHSTILAVQRADLEFEMMMQVRNKVVSAYQEIMRMQM
jgi:flagellar hook-basal body complex protein FliE